MITGYHDTMITKRYYFSYLDQSEPMVLALVLLSIDGSMPWKSYHDLPCRGFSAALLVHSRTDQILALSLKADAEDDKEQTSAIVSEQDSVMQRLLEEVQFLIFI
jgi:hypothetical protein